MVQVIVINLYDRLSLKTLVETGYRNLFVAIEKWNVIRVIDAFIDAKAEADYVPLRGLKMVICAEMLKTSYFKFATHGGYILTPNKYKRTVKDKIEQLLKDIFNEEGVLRLLTTNISNLNRYPFRLALTEMCESVGLPVRDEDITKFVKIRNKLVHKGSFPLDLGNEYEQYIFLSNFVGTFLLAALGYTSEQLQNMPTNPKSTYQAIAADIA